MDYVKELLKKSGITAVIESLVFAILGIVLICQPETVMSIIAYVIGAIFIAIGTIKILNYISDKGKNDLYNYELVFGIMAAIVGLVVIVHHSSINKIFGIIIGIWIIYSSVVRFSSAIKLKALNNNIWLYALAISVIMFICGLYMTLNSGILIVTIGILMVIYAVMDIIENVILIHNVNNL